MNWGAGNPEREDSQSHKFICQVGKKQQTLLHSQTYRQTANGKWSLVTTACCYHNHYGILVLLLLLFKYSFSSDTVSLTDFAVAITVVTFCFCCFWLLLYDNNVWFVLRWCNYTLYTFPCKYMCLCVNVYTNNF